MSTTSLDASRLESLLESAQLLNSSLDLDSLLGHLLRTVMGRLLVGRGFIAVEDEGTMRLAQVRGLKGLKSGDVFDEDAVRGAGIHFIYTIGEAERGAGLLGVSRPPAGSIAPEEEASLRALLGLAASSIANAQAHTETRRINHELDEKVQELRALLDLVRGLNSTLEPDEVARLLVLTLTGRWAVGKHALSVRKVGHPTVSRQKGIALPPIEEIQELIAELPDAVLVADLPEGDFKESLLAQQAQLIFPLRSSVSTSGLLVFGSRMGKLPYTEADLEFGEGLVAQAGVALENSWYVRETLERKKIEQELELAATIQEGLFPERLPAIKGYELFARNRAARWCGGDYYDVLPVESVADGGEKSFLLCVADVSGKGLPASLLMSNMQATLRALLGRVPTLVELAARTNELLHATTPSNKFVTAILLEITPATGEARYVNAGHGDCLLLRGARGEAERLESTGLPLGMMPSDMLEMIGKGYEEKRLQLGAGDLLALYSDGVTEAYDEAENEWGDERLLECMRPIADAPAEAIVEKVFEEIDRFAGDAPQHDDITLLVIKRMT
ncbi:MAG: SpoIIE family protein phosphatase [Pyrinomonadaceae bacterium]|nr:SpoIIE family protein phosphatase [Pyrinomonadaceae bacterium]